jgi:hypothetical protein
MTRIAFITTTMQGAGHLARAYAIFKGIERLGGDYEFTVIAPESPYPTKHIPWKYVPVAFERSELQTAVNAEQSGVAQALRQVQPDLVVVDMFWLPLFHLRSLPEFSKNHWWLLLRNVPRTWLHGSLMIRWDRSQYQRVIGIEPLVDVATTHQISPVVGNERVDPLPAPMKDCLIAHVGMGTEFEELRARYAGSSASVEAHTLSALGGTFPISQHYSDYARIIGGGGYNFVWETVWAGLRDRTEYTAFRRPIDDQQRRIEVARSFVMKKNGADELARMLRDGD